MRPGESETELRDWLRRNLALLESGSLQCSMEAACWAIVAAPDAGAQRWLLPLQQRDGSWPGTTQSPVPNVSVTALAVLGLLNSRGARDAAVGRALRFLEGTAGLEGHWLWRWKFRLVDRAVQMRPEFVGWPWTPGAVSWVVPTALAILALSMLPASDRISVIDMRLRSGSSMLLDRRCQPAGWNAGNSVVLGVPLAAHVDATALALLGLWQAAPKVDLNADLDWLGRQLVTCRSAYSLAMGVWALKVHGREVGKYEQRLSRIGPESARDLEATAYRLLARRAQPGCHPINWVGSQ